MTGLELLLCAAGITLALLGLLLAVVYLVDLSVDEAQRWLEDRKAKPYESQRVAQLRNLLKSGSGKDAA